MNTIDPPVFWAIMCLAEAWAIRKAPVVFISRVRRNSAAVISIAWVQPTTPAKERTTSMEPRCLAVSVTAALTAASSVMSTVLKLIFAEGNSAWSSLALRDDWVGFTSKIMRPFAPCSRRARAAWNPVFILISIQYIIWKLSLT